MVLQQDVECAGDGDAPGRRPRVAFLFLGELFLIPHLLPVAVALSRQRDAPAITLFVITSVHEEIVLEALAKLAISTIAVRRARGFRRCPEGARETPHLPWKPQILLRNAGAILRHDVAVVVERTSLWLPRLARGRGASFVYNEHGAGPHANFASPRNRAASWIMMPGEGMAARFKECGNQDANVAVVGYIKRDFIDEISGSGTPPRFPETRPTVVYVPHWLHHKSSWWDLGERVLEHFAASETHNLIVAPHIRLLEFVPDFEARVARYRDCPNIHIDATSFRLIDQSYINGADIYLGDGSSQVLEFAERPRPAIFLNPQGYDWENDPRYSHWAMGDVIASLDALDEALAEAPARHVRYEPIQRAYVRRMMGPQADHASTRAAKVVQAAVAAKLGRSLRADHLRSDGVATGPRRALRGAWRPGRAVRPIAASWRRAAAMLLLVGSGWLGHDLTGGLFSPAAAESFVDEASLSYQTGVARQAMRSQIESTHLDRAEILRTTGLTLPRIPDHWLIQDVQVYPAEAGLAVAIAIRTDKGELVSLFAARADTPAGQLPLLANRQSRSIAYWEDGPLAYALTSEIPAARLLAVAARFTSPPPRI